MPDRIIIVDKETMYVCHMDTEILLVGTRKECQAHKDAQPFITDCWKVNKLEDYGHACYEMGYETAEPQWSEM